jgi:exodeoxyribonuclease VII large subunit
LINHLKTKQAEAQRLLLRYHPRQLIGILRERLQEQTQRLEKLNPLHRADKFVPVNQRNMELDDLAARLEKRIKEQWQLSQHRLDKAHARIEAMDPKKVLSRGYSMISSSVGIISTQSQFKKLKTGEVLQLVFQDGTGQVQKIGGDL